MNPGFLDPPLSTTPLALSHYAFLREGTRQAPAPGARGLFQPFTRRLDANLLRHRVAVTTRLPHSTVCEYCPIWTHPHHPCTSLYPHEHVLHACDWVALGDLR